MGILEMDKTLQEQAKMIDNLLSSPGVQRKIRLATRRQANQQSKPDEQQSQQSKINQDEPLNLIKDRETPKAAAASTKSTAAEASDPIVLDIKTERDEDLDSIEEIEVMPPPPKKSRVACSSRSAGSFGQSISLTPTSNLNNRANLAGNINYPSILWPTITKKDLMNESSQEKKLPAKQPLKRPLLLPIVTSLEQPHAGAPPFTMRILLPTAEVKTQSLKANPNSPQIIPDGDLTPENIINLSNDIIQQRVSLEIVEQPACNRIRFRYECEGRSQSLQGISTTRDNRTYPKIRINGYKGHGAKVVVSCVEEKPPFRCHPHNLVGKRCESGICRIDVDHRDDMSILFKDLGVQCVKKRDTSTSLEARKAIGVDPFKKGFQHMQKGLEQGLNLNAIRLCFQASLVIPGRDEPVHLKPVISEVIRDKKAYNDLTIVDCSDNWSSVLGGKKILLFTKKISKTDIEVHFSYNDPKSQDLVIMKGSFAQTDVHEQCGISLVTPPFPDQLIKEKISGQMYLYRPSENMTSESISFTYYPLNQDPYSTISSLSPNLPELVANEISDEELDTQSKSSTPAPAPLQQSSIETIIDNFNSIVETEEDEDYDDDPEERPLEIVDDQEEEEEEISCPPQELKHPLKVRAIEDLMKGGDEDKKRHLQTQTEEINVKDMLCRYFQLMEDLEVPELTMVLEMAANMIRKKFTKPMDHPGF